MRQIRKAYMWLLVRIVLLAAMIWIIFFQVLLFVQAPDNGMFPSVKAGDLLIGFRMERNYVKNDVVLYEKEGKIRAGRVLAKEGDVVQIDESGTLTVNGTIQTGEILFPTYPGDDQTYPLRVPEGSLYVLGDHRTETIDSRELGCISFSEVRAKVITVFRRRNL